MIATFQVLQKIAASIENGEFAQNERKTATQLLQEVDGYESEMNCYVLFYFCFFYL